MFLNIKNVVVACFLSFLLSVSVFAQDVIEKPNTSRKGFTLELGLGGGYNLDSSSGVNKILEEDLVLDSSSEINKIGNGIAFAINIVLGGYINPKFALLYHIAGSAFLDNDKIQGYSIGSFYVHYWLNDDIFIGGGPGLGILTYKNIRMGVDYQNEFGLSIGGRVGYAIVSQGNHAINISLNISNSLFLDTDSSLHGADIYLSWNFL